MVEAVLVNGLPRGLWSETFYDFGAQRPGTGLGRLDYFYSPESDLFQGRIHAHLAEIRRLLSEVIGIRQR